MRAWQGVSLIATGMLCLPASASADPWAAPGNTRLRHDLQLLSDAGLVHAPLTAWPVSWAEVSRDLGAIPDNASLAPHLEAAVARLRAAAREAAQTGQLRAEGSLSVAEEPVVLRRFGATPREEGEASAALQMTGERFAVRLQATVVADPSDGQKIRADGSYVGSVLGNWMLSAGYIDRWWGPGWEGSLIYGSNQRPIPSLTLERNYSDPFQHPWLAWIGQWRLAVTVGQLEGHRQDAPDAKFFGMRATWKPHPRLEVGLSRSAQLCGEGRPCGLSTFWDMFIGDDNDPDRGRQPGNQLGGFDARWLLPRLPVALYAQAIGEDEANSLPSKYLGLAGIEAWGGVGDSSWRVHVEYADTACAFYDDPPEFGCAYDNTIYTDGYRYRGLAIGHPIDADGQQLAGALLWVRGDGSTWEFAAQSSKLNRASAARGHTLTPVALDWRTADVTHRRTLLGGDISVSVGYREATLPSGPQLDEGWRGYVQWSTGWE